MVAPAIASLAGIGISSLWLMYRRPGSKTWLLLPLSLLVAAAVQAHVLADYPSLARWLTPLIIAGSAVAAVALIAGHLWSKVNVRFVLPVAALGVMALMAAPSAWAAYSVSNAQTGGILHAGPTASSAQGGFGGPPGGNNGAFRPQGNNGQNGGFTPPNGRAGGPPGGSGTGSNRPPAGFTPPANGGGFPGGPGGGPPGGFGGAGRPGNGGPGGDTQVNTALVRYLEQHQGSARYLVATASAQSAESLILATGKPVMALGGFTGSDPILTVSQLAKLVKQGVVHYFLLGGMGGPGGGNSAISAWVQEHGTVVPASTYSSSTSSIGGVGGGSLYYVGAGK
jgi:4-amino-4-deoxy-L-arabinose transferase-like glycosyltransferase